MNEFLKSKKQIDSATKWLQENNYTEHPISCKNWELATIIQSLDDGDLLDMGANGSFILHNAIKKEIIGRKVGIDLAVVEGVNKAYGAEYYQGDLMNTLFPANEFDTVVSQSVIEHQVDLNAFAKEVGRVLRSRGRLIVSFDYWDPKPDTKEMKLYSLDWNILDAEDVNSLRFALGENNLYSGPIDWNLQDAVINPKYCSPANVEYTFGILEFIKA